MKYFVGITDEKWFNHLDHRRPDEVNFWRPLSGTRFQAIPAGSAFLFKLHKPKHYIVGGGYFAGYSKLPLSMAWDAFGENNGAPDFLTFRNSIARYRLARGLPTADPDIGCIILTQPFFFKKEDWVAAPLSWSNSIVQGKGFDTGDIEGLALWNQVEARLPLASFADGNYAVRESGVVYGPVYGNQYLSKARLGQGAFRAMVMEAYNRKCCITGETTLPVLEAAHIKPVSKMGDNRLLNGLLLRSDMHILFDKGLIGVTPDYQIRISSNIREAYLNGKVYYAHDGQNLRSLPNDNLLRPDRDLLDWHMSNVFVA